MADLTGSWLAARFGVDPVRIERMRRAGELYGVRSPGSDEWRYPSWQFEADGTTKPAVRRLLSAAHEQRLSARQLDDLLDRKVGLVGSRTVRELLLIEGGEERALAQLRFQ